MSAGSMGVLTKESTDCHQRRGWAKNFQIPVGPVADSPLLPVIVTESIRMLLDHRLREELPNILFPFLMYVCLLHTMSQPEVLISFFRFETTLPANS